MGALSNRSPSEFWRAGRLNISIINAPAHSASPRDQPWTKLQDSNRDPRLRIDTGKLVEGLRRNRTQGLLFLYGSRPPPNDSVWKAFEKNKFEINIYDRTHGGNEKGADKSMAVDIAAKATELQIEAEFMAKYFGDAKATEKEDKTTFIITGNRNMMPAVQHVLKCKIRVELWSWKSGISQVYLDLAAITAGCQCTCWIRYSKTSASPRTAPRARMRYHKPCNKRPSARLRQPLPLQHTLRELRRLALQPGKRTRSHTPSFSSSFSAQHPNPTPHPTARKPTNPHQRMRPPPSRSHSRRPPAPTPAAPEKPPTNLAKFLSTSTAACPSPITAIVSGWSAGRRRARRVGERQVSRVRRERGRRRRSVVQGRVPVQ